MLFTLGFSTFSFTVFLPLSSLIILGMLNKDFRRPLGGERCVTPRHKSLDCIGEMNLRNIAVSAGDPDLVGLHQHVRMREAVRRFKTVGSKLDQKAQWIGEIDRIHEAPVLNAAMLDLAFVQTLYRLREGGA